ncbi:hypothetical protein D3C84_769380 [compost metagenome]
MLYLHIIGLSLVFRLFQLPLGFLRVQYRLPILKRLTAVFELRLILVGDVVLPEIHRHQCLNHFRRTVQRNDFSISRIQHCRGHLGHADEGECFRLKWQLQPVLETKAIGHRHFMRIAYSIAMVIPLLRGCRRIVDYCPTGLEVSRRDVVDLFQSKQSFG